MKNFIFCAMQSKRLQLRRLRKLQLRRKSSIPFIICITSLLVKILFSTVLKSANFMVSLFCTIFKYRMIITFLFLTFEHERLFENQLSVNRSSMKISQRNNVFNNGFNKQFTAQKMKFPLRISSVHVTKSAENCGFSHIYRRNP